PAPPAQESSRVGGEEVFPGLRADDPVDGDAHRLLKCLDAGLSFGSEDSIDRQSAQGFLDLLDLRSPVTSADQVRGLRRRLWSRFGGFRFYRFLAEEFQNPFGMQSPHLFDPRGVFHLGGVRLGVDKAVFRQYRRHGGIPQYLEVRPLFTPILQATPGGDGLVQYVLELLGLAGHAAIVDVGLETGAAASINVDADEQVSTPAICRLAASAQGRVCIAGAGPFNLNPSRF